MQISLGIDIGGSSIKYGLVHAGEPLNLIAVDVKETPRPATPEAMAEAISQICSRFQFDHAGIAFPAVIRQGYVKTAAHIDPSWVDVDGLELFKQWVPHLKVLLNDADAALLAEAQWGACRGFSGSVLLLTLGTGIGTGLMIQGKLWPNSELGHVMLPRGLEAEQWAAGSMKTKEALSWDVWGMRLQEVLGEMQRLCNPDLIVLGGAISERFDCFSTYLEGSVPVVPSVLGNRAGVAGAALAALRSGEGMG